MKKLRPEVEKCLKSHLSGRHGVTDLIDDIFISFYNVTDDEFDFMLEHANDDEVQLVVDALGDMNGNIAPFSTKRQALIVRNSYLEKFNSLEHI
jgi:hypothetical protein